MSSDASRNLQTVGNYDLILKIAEGGMGAVYKGRERTTGAIVAIKIIPPETARNPLLVKRFEQEFRAASLIDHPNVVKALDYCGTGATPYLVMEFVEGESLGQRVERDGRIEEAEAVRIISQVCEGLHRAHKQGLIHRDVKPDNILVTLAEGAAKLTDLGLVKEVEGELNLTRTGRGLGTPHFMAPEQFRNAKNADVRCDVYSLGATLYCLVTGVVPFDKTSPLDCWVKKTKNDFAPPRQLNPQLSERVSWAIVRAMNADPAQRPANCREFMEDLTGTGWKVGSGPTAANSGDSLRFSASDLWYMVYHDENNQPRTVKGSTDSIRKNIQSGLLGDVSQILVCRTKNGQFQSLKSIPEFRDLVLGPTSEPMPAAIPLLPDTPSGAPLTPVANSFHASETVAYTVPPKSSAAASSTRLLASPSSDPNAATEAYQPVREPLPARAPVPPPTRKKTPNWTPWVLLGAAIAMAAAALLLLLK
ncbi:MAG: protein kinase [Bacteroidales bacterium]|nr:protein kinase [Bacteroidales bacterium]